MTINERMLNLLSLGAVDDIVLDAPYFIDDKFLKDFNISMVVEGNRSSMCNSGSDPFEIPKRLDQFRIVEVQNDFTTEKLINRIYSNEETIKNAIERKKVKQSHYYEIENLKSIKTQEL